MRLLLLTVILSCFAFRSFAAEPFVHKETGIILPETLAGLKLGESRF